MEGNIEQDCVKPPPPPPPPGDIKVNVEDERSDESTFLWLNRSTGDTVC